MSIPSKFVAAGLVALLAAITCLAISLVAMPVPGADAAKLTACVNKKTGAVKMRLGNKAKKKCPKGWKKVRWNDSKTGALPDVYSADGKKVGRFLGTFPAEVPIYLILRNGGVYVYYAGIGQMSGFGGSPAFTDSGCVGPAYDTYSNPTPLPPTELNRLIAMVRGSSRFVFRTQNVLGELGRPIVWTGNGTSAFVSGVALYFLNEETGACQAAVGPPFTGVLVGLKKIATPTPFDFKGPLRIQ